MKSEKEQAEEIRKKRRLAAKGIKERGDGEPIDPMEDVGTLPIDQDPNEPDSNQEKQRKISRRGLIGGLALKR